MAIKKHHPRNIHINGYDLANLSKNSKQLATFILKKENGELSVDFSKHASVKALNQALLIQDYNLLFWDIPDANLCPAVPGRADLIHALADLLSNNDSSNIPSGKKVTLLDIGTGASIIYPILAHQIYGWKSVATDIDNNSLKQAKNLIQFNKLPVKVRHQKNKENIFTGVINASDYFEITCCNPPFHDSMESAIKKNKRKWNNLDKDQTAGFNFSGQKSELWCEGGEIKFLTNMLYDSVDFKSQVGWFTSLVSKKENLKPLEQLAKKLKVTDRKTIELAHGQKVMHLFCWRFTPLNDETSE